MTHTRARRATCAGLAYRAHRALRFAESPRPAEPLCVILTPPPAFTTDPQVFVIKIKLDKFAWTVYRRYTDFKSLGEVVRVRGGAVPPGSRRAAPPRAPTAAARGPAAPSSPATLRAARPTPARSQLRKLIPDVTPCPPKRIWASQTHEFLEQRRGELLGWLQTVRPPRPRPHPRPRPRPRPPRRQCPVASTCTHACAV